MAPGTLRERLGENLRLAAPSEVSWTAGTAVDCGSFIRERIEYLGDDGSPIPALLLLPKNDSSSPGVIAFHQHASQFHLGKSEVAGLQGDPLQAFGPALAGKGVAVLAPDALSFEERRLSGTGTAVHEDDWIEHYNAMAHRLVRGDFLLRKAVDDAQRAVSVLHAHPQVISNQVGTVGHSFGGLLALYHAALDPRAAFICVSGALSSFEARMGNGTGINMVELVPRLALDFGPADVLAALAPRPALVVSATNDEYSIDADAVIVKAASLAERSGGQSHVEELRVDGGHALDEVRFEAMVDWLARQARAE